MRALLFLLVLAGCHPWQSLSSIPGASGRQITGDLTKAGPYRYQLKMPPGSRIESHRHTAAMQVKVLRGSMHIIMEDVTHHYTAGDSFTIPGGSWHTEWFDRESIMELSGSGPVQTEYAVRP